MQRRRMLKSMGVSVVVLLAGCTTDTERTDRNFSEVSFFEERLLDEGIDIKELDIVDQDVLLEYMSERTTDQGLGDEIGTIAATYVLARENGLDTDRLNAIINDGDRQLASWHVRSEWVDQFNNGEMDPETLTTNVLNTTELIES